MSVRLACVLNLKKIMENKVFFNALKEDFRPQDRAFANFLILTALRRKTVLDKLIDSMLTKKIPNKNKILEYVLLLGATELLYAQTPDYAAVSEYVSIAKKLTDRFCGGMVNAVLRKAALKKDEMKKASAFPENFKEILKRDYSSEEIKQMEKMLCLESPVDLTVKENPEMWAQKLNGTLFENGTIRLFDVKINIDSMEGFNDGAWWVQDLAAALPVCLMADVKGKKVLDLCAAPGGKTAQLLSKGAVVTAVDVSPERLETFKENMRRLNFERDLSVVCAEGSTYLKSTTDMFDYILIDAPCSATGTFRKHPEVMYFKTLQDVQKQTLIQKELLSEAAKHIKSGGVICYATCALSKAEGEEQMKRFLAEHNDFELIGLSEKMVQKYVGQKLDENMFDKQVLRSLPYHNENKGGADGFFAAMLRKIN